MKCPKCQFDSPADSKFCKEYDTQLISTGKIPVKTRTLQTIIRGTIKDFNVVEIIDD